MQEDSAQESSQTQESLSKEATHSSTSQQMMHNLPMPVHISLEDEGQATEGYSEPEGTRRTPAPSPTPMSTPAERLTETLVRHGLSCQSGNPSAAQIQSQRRAMIHTIARGAAIACPSAMEQNPGRREPGKALPAAQATKEEQAPPPPAETGRPPIQGQIGAMVEEGPQPNPHTPTPSPGEAGQSDMQQATSGCQ